jgi:hypothetical protein
VAWIVEAKARKGNSPESDSLDEFFDASRIFERITPTTGQFSIFMLLDTFALPDSSLI